MSNQSNTGKKECKVCAKDIKEKAIKCEHCKSFQQFTWRAVLQLGSTFMALVVALVSVVALSIPMLKSTFQTQNSNVNVRYLGVRGHYVEFILLNTGSKEGGIGNVFLHHKYPFAAEEISAKIRMISDNSFAEPKKGVLISLSIMPIKESLWDLKESEVTQRSYCEIEIETVEYDESSKSIKKILPEEDCSIFRDEAIFHLTTVIKE